MRATQIGMIEPLACTDSHLQVAHRSPSLKGRIWPLLDRAAGSSKAQASLRTQLTEAMLYFSERESVAIRRLAVEHARALLRKSMSYHLHASVVLFRSVLYRLDGEVAKSESHIRDFQWRGPQPQTRRDHALQGRLHISQIENQIKCYDNDVASFIYKWKRSNRCPCLMLR